MTRKLTQPKRAELLGLLAVRFEQNSNRHRGLSWPEILARLESADEKLWALSQMEATGGEPDVIGYQSDTDQFVFVDCAVESPKGRRSLCYDREALNSRKKFRPENSVLGLVQDWGIELLSETQYRDLQQLGKFDTKTSSWIATPENIRALGGALFCDYRYETVFVYHNGAESYYAARGFRGRLLV